MEFKKFALPKMRRKSGIHNLAGGSTPWPFITGSSLPKVPLKKAYELDTFFINAYQVYFN